MFLTEFAIHAENEMKKSKNKMKMNNVWEFEQFFMEVPVDTLVHANTPGCMSESKETFIRRTRNGTCG